MLADFDALMLATTLEWPPIPSVVAGILVGLSLGLTGGGGGIFAVPLLVYWIGVDPKTAVSVSLVTVTVTAMVGAFERWRYGHVEVSTGLLFAAAGMMASPLGSWLGGMIAPQCLLACFSGIMLLIAGSMWRNASNPAERMPPKNADAGSGPICRRDPSGTLRITSHCAMLLLGVGLCVGLLTGLFGVGGGFLIVPAMVTFASMSVPRAVGTSLLVLTLVGAMSVVSQMASGRTIPIEIAIGFAAGSILGLLLGSFIGRQLTGPLLSRIFAAAIVLVAGFMITKTFL